MEVRTGYKQTEVGVIPIDWNVVTVGKIAEVKTGPFGSALHEEDYVNDGTPIITVEHLGERRVIHSNLPMVSDRDKARLKSYSLRQGDIVFSRVGSVDRNALIRIDENGWLFSGRLLRVRLNDQKIDAPYLSFHFHSEPFKQRVKDVAVGQTMASINTKILKGINTILPPTKAEQEIIAEALSDADALIESLERLIAKKRDLKQGAMQELLTGKKRLPGFSGEWEVKPLEECGDISSAGVDKKIRPGEAPVRLVNYLDVYRNDFLYSDQLNHWVTASPNQARRCSIQKGDVFFTPSSETRNDIGISAVAMEDISNAAYSYHVVRLRLREPWDLRFRAYAFKTKEFLDQAETLCDGNGTRYVISQGKFRSMKVHVPPLLEQGAIAEVLFDIDAEVYLLEAKLNKVRQIKQGMMQELLTGRIRLV